jgi:hypothetical protein
VPALFTRNREQSARREAAWSITSGEKRTPGVERHAPPSTPCPAYWVSAAVVVEHPHVHPIFTAFGNQDWIYDEKGNKIHWPVDNYFIEGSREATFLGQKIIKYHRTLTTYINSLTNNGFIVKKIIEPLPSQEMLEQNEIFREELRRPMMLIISAYKD